MRTDRPHPRGAGLPPAPGPPARSPLTELATLVDAGVLRPVLDRVFERDATGEALSYVQEGRAKAGKVVLVASWSPRQ
ncbi:zinc-binding dehydrogenase [Blastococcus saxobsidens]|uniref:Uncharacterized protein n=1 Tax=Blastococcus saxobsidens (strain DD2) TaxID=1146883 RepID=H6RTI7_BLASD|nr:zinc-binding dehydrogenase [Blastococcus saxobsidens]CCG01845.1 protein of unknown function [Blastococcus saxobsidens DD2]